MRWLFSTVAKHGFWPNAKHGCLATTSLAPMALSQALFIQKPWIDKILDEGKTWEIRGYLTNKRQRFYLAESKANLLKGEASLINCKLVAVKDGNGDWVPAGNTEQDQLDFFMNECNYKKMGFNPVTDMPIFCISVTSCMRGSWVISSNTKCPCHGSRSAVQSFGAQ